ncbi:Chemotaxis signal transduction protein (fragment) [Candidatus Desulfosporosinus infrequens]|uniref:Chemotaxis signal transduction protein n=1 Tax=Candidatus Desulfosporosinus infrequens TaxID=2043169 RepID=A0A2U3KGS4_9FIRM
MDVVTEVLYLESEDVEPPPPIAVGMDYQCIRGVGKLGERLIVLLELDQIMSKE